jgi:hypothetical protein
MWRLIWRWWFTHQLGNGESNMIIELGKVTAETKGGGPNGFDGLTPHP